MKLITVIHLNKIDYIPIIFELKNSVSEHILCYDNSNYDKAVALELKESILKLNKKYNLNSKVKLIELDEDSKIDITNKLNIIGTSQDNLYLNSTGADIAVHTLFANMVLENGGVVIAYDIYDNSYNKITKRGFNNYRCKNSMKIDDFLTLMGDKLISFENIDDISKIEESLNKLFLNTQDMFEIRWLLQNRKTEELRERFSGYIPHLRNLGLIGKKGGLSGNINTNIFGTLFEKFIYICVKDFDYDDILIGAKIEFDKIQVESNNIEISNEFDILMIKDNRMFFIECKLGGGFLDAVSIVYKSDSVMEYFGENAKSMIVSLENLNYKKSKNFTKFKDSVVYRAKSKNIFISNSTHFNIDEFKLKVATAFGIKDRKKDKISGLIGSKI